jgi:hypothetical protein
MEKEDDVYRTISFKDYTFMINLANMLPPSPVVRKRPFEMIGMTKKRYETANKTGKYICR